MKYFVLNTQTDKVEELLISDILGAKPKTDEPGHAYLKGAIFDFSKMTTSADRKYPFGNEHIAKVI